MSAPTNNFKKRLQAADIQYGCWLGMADGYAAEIAGTAGFDWLLVDGEHAPNDLRSTVSQLQALGSSQSEVIVRLPIGETYLVKQYLDAGVQNLLIPMVESGKQAEELVRATRYPPAGVRGVGSALARASAFNGIANYLATAGDQICLTVQVESMAGINSLDDILAVDGIDGVFIGPADLAADMGHLGDAGHKDVLDTIDTALRKIRAAGKAPGVLAMNKQFIQQCLDAGATFIGVGIDVTLFAAAMRKLAADPANP